jgi:hypothetical protein
MTREGVEDISIEDVDGDGPFAGVRPKARGRGTVDDGKVRSVVGESVLLRIDTVTDSVYGGDIAGADGGTKLIGGKGLKVGRDNVGGPGLRSYGTWHRSTCGATRREGRI